MVLRRGLITGQAETYLPELFISKGYKSTETNTFRGNASDLATYGARLSAALEPL